MKDVKCPYCGLEQDINHDDGYGYEENTLHRQECSCGKTFAFTTQIEFYHEAYKAECLNGGEHQYKPTTTFPVEFTEMYCGECGKTRKPTEEEFSKITASKPRPLKKIISE